MAPLLLINFYLEDKLVVLMNLKRNDHNYAMAMRKEASEPLQKPAPDAPKSCAMETCESEEKKNNSFDVTDNV